VLPGYDPDIKARILGSLCSDLADVKIAMAINARDILGQPNGRRIAKRIRGDSGETYDDEVLRLIEQANNQFNLPFRTVALTSTPSKLSSENQQALGEYLVRLKKEGLETHVLRQIPGYPNLAPETVVDDLTQDEPISDGGHLIVVSPGGGSGKFSVAITEIAHNLVAGRNPNFTKFETFPVFKLSPHHPLNMAFLAATADLPNDLVELHNGDTNYDKDVGNLALLQTLLTRFPDRESPLRRFQIPTDMGVNVIETGILDEIAVDEACDSEMKRRVERYETEYAKGQESIETVMRARRYFEYLRSLATIDGLRRV
jgi:uncharacterized protein (UPF0371 family)